MCLLVGLDSGVVATSGIDVVTGGDQGAAGSLGQFTSGVDAILSGLHGDFSGAHSLLSNFDDSSVAEVFGGGEGVASSFSEVACDEDGVDGSATNVSEAVAEGSSGLLEGFAGSVEHGVGPALSELVAFDGGEGVLGATEASDVAHAVTSADEAGAEALEASADQVASFFDDGAHATSDGSANANSGVTDSAASISDAAEDVHEEATSVGSSFADVVDGLASVLTSALDVGIASCVESVGSVLEVHVTAVAATLNAAHGSFS